jgi:hypothetical protein
MANNFVNAYQPLLANGGVSALGLEGVGNLNAGWRLSYNPYASGSVRPVWATLILMPSSQE